MSKKKIKIREDEGNALATIDPQNDFILANGALPVAGIKGEASLVEVIKHILYLDGLPFDYKFVTRDKHPPEEHIEDKYFCKHCTDGTRGQDFHMHLTPICRNADEIVDKGQHPAVVGISVMTSPQFHEHIAKLRRKGIKRIFMAGWAYDYCVGETAIAYAMQGFAVYVARDATRSVDLPPGNARKMKEKLYLYGVKTIFTNEIE